jgi:thiamine-phosphate pyrophosphorylase
MQIDMTPGAARALTAAARWATHLQRPALGGLELFLGLIDEEEGRPVFWLRAFGVAEDQLRRQLLGDAVPPLPESLQATRDPQTEPLIHQLLPAARLLALQVEGESTVSTEHLLLALLQQEEALRTQLSNLGFRAADLEAKLLGEQGPPLALEEPLQLSDATEQMDAARLLDANANRAREALRVLEDYCRLVLNDTFLSRACKELRHTMSRALAELTGVLFPAARDTVGDVGTHFSTPQERERSSLRAVVVANAKRLQEALRCLEEYGKLHHPNLGQAIESLRYRSYTLEKALLLGVEARKRLADARLYLLLTGATCAASLEWTIQEAAAGGVQIVQLREKEKSDRDLLARAQELREVTRRLGILFIINDRPDIARLVQADGVHLGQEDMPVAQARRIVGPDALIGVSTHSPQQAEQAILDGASYLGVGPTFPSGTKQFEHYPGLDFVRWIAQHTTLPAFAIGGITPANVDQVSAAGLHSIAVSQAIAAAEDPRQVAALLRQGLGG